MPSAQDYVELAERLIEDHADFESAARLLEWASELEPSSETLKKLALCLMKCDQGERALEVAREAVLQNAGDPVAQNALGIALADQVHEREAFEAFGRAIELDPTAYEAYFNRAAVAFQFARYDEAAADFVRGIVVEGNLLAHRLQYSSVQLELQAADAVVHQIPRFRDEAGPEYADAFRVLSIVREFLSSTKDFPRSAGKRTRVRRDLAWSIPVLRFVARTKERERDVKKSRRNGRLLDLAIRLAPEDSALRWSRFHLLRFQDADPRVGEDLEFLIRRHAACGTVRDAWISHLQAVDEHDRAFEENEVWLEQDPDCCEALRNRASMLERREEHLSALDVWNRLIDLYAEEEYEWDWDFSLYLFLDRADCLAKLGRSQEAEHELNRAVRMEKEFREREGDREGYGAAQLQRANFYMDEGRFREALGDLDECIEASPRIPYLHEERAKCREALGDTEGARQDRERSEKGEEEEE
ncbi:MAG: tetratricopeptide repeat protein [Planctomycetes bacterium]|nr:tetratricopeptide repeat protein [Planctomycetota bacterium]